MHRRRFLTLTAACAATSGLAAAPLRWTGFAMGAEVALELHGPAEQTRPALHDALKVVRRMEHLFSLYDAQSQLVRLNAEGVLQNPAPDMVALFETSSHIHAVTDGLFDPTVQAIWVAASSGGSLAQARNTVDWQKVRFDANRIVLGPGQSLTFNGIAQGFATDRVSATLKQHDLRNIHVNIGEHAVTGPARRLGLLVPEHGYLGHITIEDAALATTSVRAMQIHGHGHIFHRHGKTPFWDTASVVAKQAVWADGLSTALCLANRDTVSQIRAVDGVERFVLTTRDGDIVTL